MSLRLNDDGKIRSEYNSWHQMKQRCLNKNDKRYHDYGGRGITVCEEWMTFEGFFNDMGVKPSPDHSIDRIDNNKGYYKENCKWSDRREQQRNQRVDKRNKYKTRGVSFDKEKGKYLAQMYADGTKVLFKRFNTLEEAIEARKEAELKYW